ncbi:AIR synthase related protein [Methanogenium cariaci]|uniref:AIR synthase related protein n=1 Tax=Methanogenium cariaci TaxID=2197 RepID=UPI001FE0958F|nr:AIR synthase related protein [Methanogenium cariaci]
MRDIISMGAKPIALMDLLYFGPITEEKNRYLLEHVVQGIGDYGNCIGVPVVRGGRWHLIKLLRQSPLSMSSVWGGS